MSLDSQLPPPPGYPAQPPAPEQKGTSGLAIAGLILAIFIAPIGFILSLIAIFKTGAGKAKGRGLAIAGLIISVLIIGGSVAVIVAAANSTVLDPGCTSGKDAIFLSSTTVDATTVQASIDGLTAAAGKAKHDDVKAANLALAEDYKSLLKALQGGEAPADLEAKINTDAAAFDKLCTIGDGK
ncbi:DUF4190 domain-containing protein [Paractinoplanes durhamensis]|uniref:DUF4190 domain-containing protein n=1 Tax=Paractinoplanes durhamensis TaxID=113563 RepID=A0ABQ3Z3E6_9ACTN|nr:DUF4190 domain-containing protein [Actinoplanes durhamensis]GIE04353.1 hypothetical protein Adu01nite_57030 [Actinoplanes durhamensis]